MNAKNILFPTLKLFAIAVVITILLVLTNGLTEERIAQNQEESNVEARQEVLPEADSFEEKTVDIDGEEYTYYEATNGAGYVFSGSNKGYGGEVVTMVGMTPDGTITGVKVTEADDETPGLGQKWTDSSNTEQFLGESAGNGEMAVSKDGGSVEAVAGATFTSRAVTADVNDAIMQFNAVVGGAN